MGRIETVYIFIINTYSKNRSSVTSYILRIMHLMVGFPMGIPLPVARNCVELFASILILRGIVWNCAKITGP